MVAEGKGKWTGERDKKKSEMKEKEQEQEHKHGFGDVRQRQELGPAVAWGRVGKGKHGSQAGGKARRGALQGTQMLARTWGHTADGQAGASLEPSQTLFQVTDS